MTAEARFTHLIAAIHLVSKRLPKEKHRPSQEAFGGIPKTVIIFCEMIGDKGTDYDLENIRDVPYTSIHSNHKNQIQG